ncbi:hypothetical protein FA15DRAFT_691747 [Coprinopsis marcescibilis]|uniref:Uncharacterized protein n=1 Tax=Coprinopsis marcescibilis TaxID=230819 RepID=A0A5C3L6W1_COPMA|nr:hypothetical protein FA15DRAFT_691747 [Coprinopsis marcescibilis]
MPYSPGNRPPVPTSPPAIIAPKARRAQRLVTARWLSESPSPIEESPSGPVEPFLVPLPNEEDQEFDDLDRRRPATPRPRDLRFDASQGYEPGSHGSVNRPRRSNTAFAPEGFDLRQAGPVQPPRRCQSAQGYGKASRIYSPAMERKVNSSPAMFENAAHFEARESHFNAVQRDYNSVNGNTHITFNLTPGGSLSHGAAHSASIANGFATSIDPYPRKQMPLPRNNPTSNSHDIPSATPVMSAMHPRSTKSSPPKTQLPLQDSRKDLRIENERLKDKTRWLREHISELQRELQQAKLDFEQELERIKAEQEAELQRVWAQFEGELKHSKEKFDLMHDLLFGTVRLPNSERKSRLKQREVIRSRYNDMGPARLSHPTKREYLHRRQSGRTLDQARRSQSSSPHIWGYRDMDISESVFNPPTGITTVERYPIQGQGPLSVKRLAQVRRSQSSSPTMRVPHRLRYSGTSSEESLPRSIATTPPTSPHCTADEPNPTCSSPAEESGLSIPDAQVVQDASLVADVDEASNYREQVHKSDCAQQPHVHTSDDSFRISRFYQSWSWRTITFQLGLQGRRD